MDEMNPILKLLMPNPEIINLADGGEIHGRLKNGESVHIKSSDGILYVAIGEIPEHGSPPVSPLQAYQILWDASNYTV